MKRKAIKMPIAWEQLGIGAMFGAFFAAGANVIGHYLTRQTAVDTKKIDDRGHLTTQLMEQLEKTYTKVGELEAVVATANREKLIYMRLIGNLGAELRILNGHLSVHMMELTGERIDRHEVKQQATAMHACFTRMQAMIEREETYLGEMGREKKPVEPMTGEPPKGGPPHGT